MRVEGLLDPKDRVADVSTISDAKAAMALRRWDKAEILWLRVVERTPANTYALQGLAQLYGLTGQWSKCLAWLGRAIDQAPRAANLRRMRGAILVQLGRPAEGIEDLKRVADDSVESLTWIGAAHRALGQRDEARKSFERGLQKDPRNRWLRLYLANLLAADGSSAEAERLYRELAADEPYFALGLYNYGVLLAQLGRPEAARPLFERAARLAPQHEPTRAALAGLGASTPAAGRP
jgi:tetratricopeptide (TPR) repeat protein